MHGEQALKAGMAETQPGSLRPRSMSPFLLTARITMKQVVTACVSFHPALSGTGWAGYSFDPASGPEQVFSNFFGTSNPYEALNGGQSLSTILLYQYFC